MTTEPDTVAFINKQNGAYLINLIGPNTDDTEPHLLFAAASSLPTAKRVAKQMAADFDYTCLKWAEGDAVELLGVPR